MGQRIVALGKNLHFTLVTADQASQDTFCIVNSVHFVEISTSGDGQLHLSTVDNFSEMLSATMETHTDIPIVVCVEDISQPTKRNACSLCGAYLILSMGLNVDQACATVRKAVCPADGPNPDILSDDVRSCWQALEHARSLCWLGPHVGDQDPAFDIEAASHYACPANGGVRELVPGRLFHFPAPRPLPPGTAWANLAEPGRPAGRAFSAPFLAELLADLGASAVVCLGRAPAGDAAAFRAEDLDVHDLALAGPRPALLGAMDRLLAVSRAAAPGAVALFGGPEGMPGAGGDVAGTLAAALLMMEHGFGEAAAAAWLRMVGPM